MYLHERCQEVRQGATVAFSALLSFVGAAALTALAGLPWWTGVLAWFAALCSVGLDARALRAREAGHGGAGAGADQRNGCAKSEA